MQKIRNILLDLGGVVMDLYVERTIDKFIELGFTKEMLKKEKNRKSIFWKLEVGNLSTIQFRNCIREIVGKDLKDEKIDEAWHAMIGGFSAEKIQIIKQLKKKYQLFLLSNTCESHIEFCNQNLKKEHGLSNLDALFDTCFYSFKMGMGKPDPGIFKKVILEAGMVPGETFFVDDIEENIKAAERLGFHTFLFPLNSDLKQIFKKLSAK